MRLDTDDRIVESHNEPEKIPIIKVCTIESDEWVIEVTYNGHALHDSGTWCREDAAIKQAKELVEIYQAAPPLIIQVRKTTNSRKMKYVGKEDYFGKKEDVYEAISYGHPIKTEIVWDSAGNFPRNFEEVEF